jgi:hypothetical protein
VRHTHLTILLLIQLHCSMICVPYNIYAGAMPTCASARMSGSANPAAASVALSPELPRFCITTGS